MFHSILYKALSTKFPRFKIASIFIILFCGIGSVDANTEEEIYPQCSRKTISKLSLNCHLTPNWLKEAKTSSETVSIRKDGYVIWHNGTWVKGLWWNGTWEDGTWENGWWNNGTWEKGTWWKGNWRNGTWVKGTWWGGIWIIGRIYNNITGGYIYSNKAPGS